MKEKEKKKTQSKPHTHHISYRFPVPMHVTIYNRQCDAFFIFLLFPIFFPFSFAVVIYNVMYVVRTRCVVHAIRYNVSVYVPDENSVSVQWPQTYNIFIMNTCHVQLASEAQKRVHRLCSVLPGSVSRRCMHFTREECTHTNTQTHSARDVVC